MTLDICGSESRGDTDFASRVGGWISLEGDHIGWFGVIMELNVELPVGFWFEKCNRKLA